jgi:hypothetical protein
MGNSVFQGHSTINQTNKEEKNSIEMQVQFGGGVGWGWRNFTA